MKNISTFLIFISFFSHFTTNAQSSRTRAKWQEAITALDRSDFTANFTRNKESIEKQVYAFMKAKSTLNPVDVEDVKRQYEVSQREFNSILDDLKSCFLDKNTRDIIAKTPDSGTKFFQMRLDNALKTYENNCLAKMEALTKPTQGAFGIGELQLIFGLGSEIFKLIDSWKENLTKMTGEYFEQNYVYKLRLKKWDQY
jgi:hypothetical protein